MEKLTKTEFKNRGKLGVNDRKLEKLKSTRRLHPKGKEMKASKEEEKKRIKREERGKNKNLYKTRKIQMNSKNLNSIKFLH